MKPLKIFIVIGSFLSISCLSAQQMQEGFTYLEQGKFGKAEMFFETILKEYPNNKTARLCYGRAVGLNGNAKKANDLFTYLMHDYPSDFEVKLNFGESLLWNGKFNEAQRFYKNLVTEQPQSFPALLGYANTLSNLKDYENALAYVNKALEVSPGNPNALTSKKYIYLGYAYQNQQAQDYEKAEALLIQCLELFKNNTEALLNLGSLYLIWERLDDAKSIYKTLSENIDTKLQGFNGLVLVAHLKGKEKQALQLSTQAYEAIATTTQADIKQQTLERYIQALIWNKKFKTAETLINDLAKEQPNQNWVLALRATLNTYKSNFKKSLAYYNTILQNDSTSFDGNLGKANALKALERYDEAYTSAQNTLKFYKHQKDAVSFIEQLDAKFKPYLETKAAHSFDNGNNKSYTISNNIRFPLSKSFSVLANHNYLTTNNSVTNAEATSNTFGLGLQYDILPKFTLKGVAGLTSATTQNKDFNQLTADVSLSIRALKLQTLDIGYKRQVEFFNADLLNQELVQNTLYANYNLSTNFNLGWFTQLMHTNQSDGNTRNLLFASLYYNVLSKPILKAGINYQYMSFKNQVPALYFSPERFNATELFANLVKDESQPKPKQWFYNLTAALGYQFIENNARQSTYRFQGQLGYKFSKRTLLNFYGTHSNIASANAAGFTFTEVGLKLRWIVEVKEGFTTN